MDMNRSLAEFWSDHNAEIIVTVLSLVVFGLLLRITNRNQLTPSDLTQIGTLMVLVIVTVSYAAATHRIERASKEQAEAARKQAEESQRAVEVALRAERNAVMPIVKLLASVHPRGTIDIATCNAGRGPALNLTLWGIYLGPSGDEVCERVGGFKDMSVLGVRYLQKECK